MSAPRDTQSGRYFGRHDRSMFPAPPKAKPAPQPAQPQETSAPARRVLTPIRKQK